jgi:CRISPR-associated protein Cas2
MYVILVYDIEQERIAKVCKFLRRYLHWVQNSVFEGAVTEAKLMEIKQGLKQLIDTETDSVYVYQLRDEKWVDKEILGVERNPTDPFI